MANVKLSEKQVLEQIQAKIVLLKGKKISQQEILDKCILYSDKHFEAFIREEFDSPKLTKEKINQIISTAFNSGYHFPEKSDDELIYNL
jgi:hypothetical protein